MDLVPRPIVVVCDEIAALVLAPLESSRELVRRDVILPGDGVDVEAVAQALGVLEDLGDQPG